MTDEDFNIDQLLGKPFATRGPRRSATRKRQRFPQAKLTAAGQARQDKLARGRGAKRARNS